MKKYNTKTLHFLSLGFLFLLYFFPNSIPLFAQHKIIESHLTTKSISSSEIKKNADYLLSKALLLYFNKQHVDSKIYFNKYLDLYRIREPKNNESRYNENLFAKKRGLDVIFIYLARIYIIEGNLNKAEKFLLIASKINHKNITIYQVLAYLYQHQKNIKKLIWAFKSILKIDAYNEEALSSLIFLSKRTQNYRKVMVYSKKLLIAIRKKIGNNQILAEAYRNLGGYYFQNHDFEKATFYYKKLYESNPLYYQYSLYLGDLYKLTGHFKKAISFYEKSFQLNPKMIVALENSIECHFILGSSKIRPLIGTYFKNTKKPNESILAIMYFLNNKYSEAKNYFLKYIKKKPNRLSAHMGLMRIYLNTNKLIPLKKEAYITVLLAQKYQAYDIALQYIPIVFKILDKEAKINQFNQKFYKNTNEPLDIKTESLAHDFIDIYLTHARNLERLSKFKASYVYYRFANQYIQQIKKRYKLEITNQKNNEPNINNKKSRRSKIIAYRLKKAQEKEETSLLNQLWMSQYFKNNNLSRTQKIFNKAIKLYPKRSLFHFYLGLIYYNQGTKRKEFNKLALKQFQKAYDKSIANKYKVPGKYFFYIGMTLEKLDNFKEAEKYLIEAIKREPTNPTYLNYLGYMYSLKNMKLNYANQLLFRALEDDPENEAYLDSIGWIYFKEKKYTKALEQLLLAANYTEKNKSFDAIIFYHLAETYMKLNEPTSAHFYYTKALKSKQLSSEKLDINRINSMLKKIKEQEKK